jgi:hypothetical protein
VIVTLLPVLALLAGAQIETPGDAGRQPPPLLAVKLLELDT